MAIHGVGRILIYEHLPWANGRASSNSPFRPITPLEGPFSGSFQLAITHWPDPLSKADCGPGTGFSSHKAVGQSVLLGDWPMAGLRSSPLWPKGRMSKGEYISPRDMAPPFFHVPLVYIHAPSVSTFRTQSYYTIPYEHIYEYVYT